MYYKYEILFALKVLIVIDDKFIIRTINVLIICGIVGYIIYMYMYMGNSSPLALDFPRIQKSVILMVLTMLMVQYHLIILYGS